MRKDQFTISTLICPGCGAEYTVPRSKGRERPPGHRKMFYCIKCQSRTNMLEIREFDSREEILAFAEKHPSDAKPGNAVY